MEEYKAKITKIVFHSEDNGYIIARTDKGKTVKGEVHHTPKDLIGVPIEFIGEETKNANYGTMDFSFKEYRMKMNFSTFFLNKIVKIPEKVCEDIIKTFGEDLESIIENSPSRLTSIKGIAEKKKEKIVKLYKENKGIHELAEFLLPFGISASRIQKIQEYYKKINKNAIAEIKKNPYVLTKMDRVGFKRADEIALKIGMKTDSDFRIQQGIVHALDTYIESGHTYIDNNDLFTVSAEVLNIDEADENRKSDPFQMTSAYFTKGLDDLISMGDQIKIVFEGKYSRPHIIRAEENIYNTINKHSVNSNGNILSDSDLEKYIERAEEENGFKFGEKQKESIRLGNKRMSIFFVYGLAGSGKTTVAKDVIRLYNNVIEKDDIVVTSLSGVAANRAKTVTGYQGMTIHSLLGIDTDGNFKHNKENKLQYNMIMLDECSMVDSLLFSKLIDAIDFSKTVLMMVGDPAQLQSIGPGDLYRNIISSGKVQGVGLDQVFRQSSEQVINIFATKYVREGKMLEEFKRPYKDFSFTDISIPDWWERKKGLTDAEQREVRDENNKKILGKIIEIAKTHKNEMRSKLKEKDVKKYISTFQAITPQKNGPVGTEMLNRVLQKIFNGAETDNKITVGDDEYKVFDKVIHLKNEDMVCCSLLDYKNNVKNIVDYLSNLEPNKRVFNGQLGMILKVDKKDGDENVFVFYPNEEYIVMYPKESFAKVKISLAYAMTIHKSQGSEFGNVVFPVTLSHYRMLNNQLFYTAFTRAKDKLYIPGEEYALKRGCTNVYETKRNTILNLYFNQRDDGSNAPIIESDIDPQETSSSPMPKTRLKI